MTSKAGLYIHIPFCKRKCPYCDFYSVSEFSQMPAFVDALLAEMRMKKEAGLEGLAFGSVYIGGGTPTVMETRFMSRIMEMVFKTFPVDSDAEITIEANPASISEGQLSDLRLLGINRINIGVQSFDDANLAFLGRRHSADDSRESLHLAKKCGFENIGLDLIYGLPGQKLANWRRELENALSFSLSHISAYMLTLEPGTPMHDAQNSGAFKPLSGFLQGRMFSTASRVLSKNGFSHYEISNFASSAETRSVHNRCYWNNQPYMGLGPAAHSYLPPVRTANVDSLKRYIGRIKSGNTPVESTERLNRRQQMIEAVYLGLRQARGICYGEFEKRFRKDFMALFSASINRFSRENYLIADEIGCRLTLEGMLMQESIAGEFIDQI